MIINEKEFSEQIDCDTSIDEYEAAWLDYTAKIYAIYQDELPGRDVPWSTAMEEMMIERGYRYLN